MTFFLKKKKDGFKRHVTEIETLLVWGAIIFVAWALMGIWWKIMNHEEHEAKHHNKRLAKQGHKLVHEYTYQAEKHQEAQQYIGGILQSHPEMRSFVEQNWSGTEAVSQDTTTSSSPSPHTTQTHKDT